ncbi:hypothetical protein EHP00_1754 [Ecytonucleospora hepatopenaei]|uniref:Uncharacterized protein n=1 Tax=Ecytonucleospora hepatopenaei TaxID=646526 RepID=A0A1W0E4M2_9MICR|nr:hypothetical protein EHP00_1754 [Ecytonucleospora hepatopenaei]
MLVFSLFTSQTNTKLKYIDFMQTYQYLKYKQIAVLFLFKPKEIIKRSEIFIKSIFYFKITNKKMSLEFFYEKEFKCRTV